MRALWNSSRSRPPDQIVTTDEVLSEYLTRAGNRSLPGLNSTGPGPDKGYSLTDCISMITMHREGLTEALTSTGISSRKDSVRCSGKIDIGHKRNGGRA